jgi:hypothetical protein
LPRISGQKDTDECVLEQFAEDIWAEEGRSDIRMEKKWEREELQNLVLFTKFCYDQMKRA